MDPPFPRSIGEWWFGCEDSLSKGTLDSLELPGAVIYEDLDFPELELNESDFQNSTAEEPASSGNITSNEHSLDFTE